MSYPKSKRLLATFDSPKATSQKKRRLDTAITNQEYNNLCLNPFGKIDRADGYNSARNVKIKGLSQTAAVPMQLVTPELKVNECKLEMRRTLQLALDEYSPLDDWHDDSYSLALSAAGDARMAQLHQLGITEMHPPPESTLRDAHSKWSPVKLQPGSKLLNLPPEIRDMIYHHTFRDIGKAYFKEQLQGFSGRRPKYLSPDLLPLGTCRQIYAEASEIAYSEATTFHFAEYLQRSLPMMIKYAGPYRIAFWIAPSTPLMIEQHFKDLLKLRIRSLTICTSFTSLPLTEFTKTQWARLLFRIARGTAKLEELHILTGCALARPSRQSEDERSKQLDGGFAQDLRNGWNSFVSRCREKADSNVHVEGFSDRSRSTTTTLRFSFESSKIDKTVVLHIASVEAKVRGNYMS
ncbi:hypothetical protein B0O99DRAFT_99611 [Bisporella sp. PMI_857]|nr:hypothetical protein B0O99DRAFT_99611 [Bisporella sp. PMI_857]